MRYLMLLSSLLIVGCGEGFKTASDPRSIVGVDPAFASYVTYFEQLGGISVGDVSIGFESQSGNVIGVCTRWSNGYRQIAIDPEYWNDPTVSERSKVSLMFHELGHCVLNRDHVNSLYYYSGTHIAGQVPYSLMYPYNFYSDSYAELESYYFNELFHPTNMYSTVGSKASHEGCVHDIQVEPN